MKIKLSKYDAEVLRKALIGVSAAVEKVTCDDLMHAASDQHEWGDTCFAQRRLQGEIAVVRAFADRLKVEY